jgi:hypothetical protein
MAGPNITRTCQTCSTPLRPNQRAACGVRCRGAQRRTRVSRECRMCKRLFSAIPSEIKSGGGKFCSYPCYWKHKEGDRSSHFWKRVDRTGDCWLWRGQLTNKGYGEFRLARLRMLAHRFAYELTYGTIPAGLVICHMCDTPPCVRPEHLQLATQSANMYDCLLKGRTAKGVRNGHAKLTDATVHEARVLYATGGQTFEQLGHLFGVSRQVISKAVRRLTWQHVM